MQIRRFYYFSYGLCVVVQHKQRRELVGFRGDFPRQDERNGSRERKRRKMFEAISKNSKLIELNFHQELRLVVLFIVCIISLLFYTVGFT